MISYDSTQIAIYIGLVLAMAALGIGLALAAVGYALACHRRLRLERHQTVCRYYGRLALHH